MPSQGLGQTSLQEEQVILLGGSSVDTTPAVPDVSIHQEDVPKQDQGVTSLQEYQRDGNIDSASEDDRIAKAGKTAKKSFKFNKIGKLKPEEMVEIVRTHKNIFAWLKPNDKATAMDTADKADLEIEMPTNTEEVFKEERLARVRSRQLAWGSSRICKAILKEILEVVVDGDDVPGAAMEGLEPVVGGVMGPGSNIKYLGHHGGAHTPLLVTNIIAEKGVDLCLVIGGQSTGDNRHENVLEAANTPSLGLEMSGDIFEQRGLNTQGLSDAEHTPTLGPRTDQAVPVICCVQPCTLVQPIKISEDLIKVEYESGSPESDRGGEGGEMEFVGLTNIETMIAKWEAMENDANEWKVEEGVRRGGRKLSKRISELLGRYEGKRETLEEGGGGQYG